MTQYKRPPITEAVIEIRLDEPIPGETVETIQALLKGGYRFSDPFSETGLSVDLADHQTTVNKENNGYKLASEDRTDVLMIMPDRFSCSRLAPYNGWELFRARAVANWRKWKRVTKYRKIKSLGVRYINRIDIPNPNNDKIRIEDYLMVYPLYPEPDVLSILSNYAMQLEGDLGQGNFKLVINSGIMPSPLVGYSSILLDLDIVRAQDVPQNDNEIWGLIDLIRNEKNRIFESCVTDNARELFNK